MGNSRTALGAYDGYKYAQKKGYTGWKKAAAIAGGAVLGAVNPFKVVKAAKTVTKVVKASKYTKAAVSAKKTTKVVKKVKAKPKQTVVAKKSTQEAFKKATAKKTAQTVKKQQKKVKAACFTAGTKIHTKDGYKNIEAIKVGDYVWSENPETKEKALKKVKKIFVREKDSIIRLAINGEAIETTDEHPFYVEGKGFTEAKWLKAGDEVRLATGNTAEVDTIESVQLDSPVKVYNFEVEDYHTYYVSGQKVLVHNTCAVSVNNVNSVNSSIISMNPDNIRFSQSSVNGAAEIIDSMKKNGWVGEPIDIVKMSDGKFTTVDNTRLLATKYAGINVKVKVHSYEDVLPNNMIDRFTTRKGVPTTWGDAVNLRIGKQNQLYRDLYPYGSNIIGWKGN